MRPALRLPGPACRACCPRFDIQTESLPARRDAPNRPGAFGQLDTTRLDRELEARSAYGLVPHSVPQNCVRVRPAFGPTNDLCKGVATPTAAFVTFLKSISCARGAQIAHANLAGERRGELDSGPMADRQAVHRQVLEEFGDRFAECSNNCLEVGQEVLRRDCPARRASAARRCRAIRFSTRSVTVRRRFCRRSAPANAPTAQARSTSNATTLRASLLNSTAIRWIGWPRLRYLSA